MPRPPKRIPKGSVFHEYRGLPRVGQEPVWDLGDSWPAIDWNLDMVDGVPESHPIHKYLGSAQIEASLIAGSYKSRELSLTIDHCWLFMLAGIMKEWLFDAFPIKFRFIGVREFHVIRTVEHGRYQMLRCSRDRVYRNLSWVHHLRMLKFEDDHVAFVARFEHERGFRRKGVEPVLPCVDEVHLCVSAERLILEERHREGWIKHMGADREWIFDEFFADYKYSPRGNSDYEDWLERKKIPYQRATRGKRVWTNT